MKAKKKPIIMTALSVLLCLSLVFGFVSESSIVAFAVTQDADNKYVFDFGDKVHIVGWYGDWDDYPTPWKENSTDEWWNDAVSIFNGRRWKTEPYMRWQNGGDDLQHNFLAWYPEDFVTSNSDLTNVSINLTGDPEEDDILIAKWRDTRPEVDTLHLEFDHLLARFDLNIVFGSEYPDAKVVSVKSWLPRTGTCNLLNDEFRATYIQANLTYEMKETTGNTDVSRGSVSGGVTSGSAISALQESAGKTSRSQNQMAYEAYKEVILMVIELIRQFYDTTRQFRITGKEGIHFKAYNNANIKPQKEKGVLGLEESYRLPVFDVEVSAQKQNPYTKNSQNELALQLYGAGFFAPQNGDVALACLDIMDFGLSLIHI